MTARAWRQAIICVSLSNLWFLESWAQLHRLRSGSSLSGAAGRTEYVSLLAAVGVLAAVFFVAARWVSRWGSKRWRLAGWCAFLLATLAPIDWACGQGLKAFADSPHLLYCRLAAGFAVAAPLLGCVRVILNGSSRIGSALFGVVRIAAPVLPIQAAVLGWAAFAPPPQFSRPAPSLAAPRPARVIWMVFDEMDYRIAFEKRPVPLPEFDRLRKEALFATAAESPGWDTAQVMGSLLTGQKVRRMDIDPLHAAVTLESGRVLPLQDVPTVFSKARQRGFATAAAGWYLPYCFTLTGDLSRCAQPLPDNYRATTFAECWRMHWSMSIERGWLARRITPLHAQAAGFSFSERNEFARLYEYLLAEARRMAISPEGGLILIHWPIPHAPGIYDREGARLDVSYNRNYVDNLALADATLGRIRADLEAAHLWGSTGMVIMADHGWRPDLWKRDNLWSVEEERLSKGGRSPIVPFLVKLPGQPKGREHTGRFSTISTHSLLLELLENKQIDYAGLTAWLERLGWSTTAQYSDASQEPHGS